MEKQIRFIDSRNGQYKINLDHVAYVMIEGQHLMLHLLNNHDAIKATRDKVDVSQWLQHFYRGNLVGYLNPQLVSVIWIQDVFTEGEDAGAYQCVFVRRCDDGKKYIVFHGTNGRCYGFMYKFTQMGVVSYE